MHTYPSKDNMAIVYSVNINPLGGVPKLPVNNVDIRIRGVKGDKQNDLRYHGGPQRAVCLFSLELIQQLQKEGHPISPGSTGENITNKGIDWELLKSGMKIDFGQSIIRLTDTAAPCKTIIGSFSKGKFERILEKKNPGWSRWYASVIKEGVVNPGDQVVIK